jgi:hypothetical protein
VFASALDEYDQACHQHDAEMDGIRAAFMAKWGRLPVLETYRQMAIRQQKARNFEQALWWAERGIAIADLRHLRARVPADPTAGSHAASLPRVPRPDSMTRASLRRGRVSAALGSGGGIRTRRIRASSAVLPAAKALRAAVCSYRS